MTFRAKGNLSVQLDTLDTSGALHLRQSNALSEDALWDPSWSPWWETGGVPHHLFTQNSKSSAAVHLRESLKDMTLSPFTAGKSPGQPDPVLLPRGSMPPAPHSTSKTEPCPP